MIPALLAVARRFADHLVDHFLGRQEGIDGHPIVETALAELYRETGHEPYLRLASQFIEQRGHGLIGDSGFGHRYLQDHEPVRDTVTQVGHVVRALYLDAGVADVAAETGDAPLLASSLTRWADMVAAKTYLTGGNGSRHEGESFGDRFELPPDRAYNETCAAIASFQWAWRLLLATGDAAYADLMERVLYNGFASSTATGGTRFFYVNPLQRRADHFEKDDPGRRREWFNCACCPPNIMRTMASLQHYLATASGGTLYVQQFTGATLSAPLAGGVLGVEMATDYPWSGDDRAAGDRRPAAPLRAGRAGAGLVPATAHSPQRRPHRGRARRRVPGGPPPVAPRRCAPCRTGHGCPADLPRPPGRRGARDGRDRARAPRLLPRAGRPARRCRPRGPGPRPRRSWGGARDPPRPGRHDPHPGQRGSPGPPEQRGLP